MEPPVAHVVVLQIFAGPLVDNLLGEEPRDLPIGSLALFSAG